MGLLKKPEDPIVRTTTMALPRSTTDSLQREKDGENVFGSVWFYSFGLSSLWYLNGIVLSSPASYTPLRRFKGNNKLPV